MIGIYVLEDTTNGKLYVGQSIDVEKRLGIHKRACNKKMYIDRAINKHGWDNFNKYTFDVSEDTLNDVELEVIQKLNSLSPNGYNLDTGGANGSPCEETRALMSANHTDVSGENNPMFGKPGLRGEKHPMWGDHPSEETIALQSEAKKGEKNHMYGKKCPEHSLRMTGENNPRWSGDNATPSAIRRRKRKNLDGIRHREA